MKVYARNGFTLIELLVVMAIIGLLSTVALSSLNSARVKARDLRKAGDVKQLRLAIDLYYDRFGIYPPGEDDSGPWGWGVDYDYSGSFIPSLVSAGLLPRGVRAPGDPNGYGYYQYMWRNGGVSNKGFMNLNCGPGTTAQAFILFVPENGPLPGWDTSWGSSNANIVCFY